MVSRRTVVKAMAAGSGLILSGCFFVDPTKDAASVNHFLRISRDDTITILSVRSELGQGTHTGVAVLIAEELDADWSKIRVETADLRPEYVPDGRSMRTAGSDAISSDFDVLRRIGATAREMLRQAAACRWRVPLSETRVEKGVVYHELSGRSANYGELAAAAARGVPPKDVVLRDPSSWKLIGAEPKRLDARAKVDGSALFGIDVQVPGMLVGTIRQCPVFGGRLRSIDPAPAMAVAGVTQVVMLSDAVVVLATGYWPAHKGAEALQPVWDLGAHSLVSDETLSQLLEAALVTAKIGPDAGDVDAALKHAARTWSAKYEVPYLAHWLIEPMNATAWVRGDQVEIWAPLQGQSDNRKAVSAALGIDPVNILIHSTYVGGSFGRRMQADVTVQAALASKAAGRPVKLVWSREEDTRHGFYRPRAKVTCIGGLDEKGRPEALKVAMAEHSTLQDYRRRNGMPPVRDLPEALSVWMKGEAYGVENYQFAHADVLLPVPVGAWHGVQFSHNGFFGESIIDELAHIAGQDPLEFRRRHAVDPRHIALLDRVGESSGWSSRALPRGHGRGVALVESFGSVVAEVVEVSVDGKAVKLRRVWCAIDCGLAVYPPGVVSQMVTGIMSGLSAAFFGEINIENGRVVQGNFENRLIRMNQAPVIDVAIVHSGAKIGGVGECSLPPAAPALVNAVFAASGERVRRLPLVKSGWTLL